LIRHTRFAILNFLIVTTYDNIQHMTTQLMILKIYIHMQI